VDNNQPIIVKRVTRKDHGHHGGSWKIAFADFAVAMMAFSGHVADYGCHP